MDQIQQTIKSFLLTELILDAPADFDDSTPLIRNRLLDSLGLMQLIVFLEDKFGIEVDPRELVPKNFETLRAITDLVQRKMDTVQPGPVGPRRIVGV